MPSFPQPGIPGLTDSPAVAISQHRQLGQLNRQNVFDQESQERANSLAEGRNKLLGQTMAGDVAQSVNAPELKGKAWADLDPYTQQSFYDRYGPAASEAPQQWNSAQRQTTGIPGIGTPQPPPGVIASKSVNPKGEMTTSWQQDTGTPDGTPSTGVLGTLPPDQAAIAKDISEYRYPYNALTRLPPVQRMRILNAVTELAPDFDANQYQTRQGTMKSFASGQDAANVASANTVIGHIAEMLKDGEALHNGSITPINAVGNFLARNTGNPAQTRFASSSTAVADEMAKLFKGTGAATDQSIKDWKATLSPNMSPEQIRASAETALSLMASRLGALHEKYSSTMGRAPDRPFLSPRSQAILRTNKLEVPEQGVQPEETAPPAQLTPEDQAALTWAQANPTDPRSKQIMALHGGR